MIPSSGCGTTMAGNLFSSPKAKRCAFRVLTADRSKRRIEAQMDQEKIFLDAVRENRDKMFRIAMSLLHVPADAEDAVSAAVE